MAIASVELLDSNSIELRVPVDAEPDSMIRAFNRVSGEWAMRAGEDRLMKMPYDDTVSCAFWKEVCLRMRVAQSEMHML